MSKLILNLESINIHNTDEGDSEWRLDVNVGNQHFDWDKNGVSDGDNRIIDHDFVFNNFNKNFDLTIFSGGKEDDPIFDDDLPSNIEVLQKGDYFDHSFTTTAQNDDFSYTLNWNLDYIA
jgi:hypothetical protein